MKHILGSDYDVDRTDSRGMSALHYAAFAGNVDLIKILVQKGANCNRKADECGTTPQRVILRLEGRYGGFGHQVSLLSRIELYCNP